MEATPKATSWAANNWNPNIGFPETEPVASPDNPTGGVGEIAAKLATIASRYEFDQGNVHVTNNVPYIQPLNNGSSKKAPAGFVEMSVMRAIRQSL